MIIKRNQELEENFKPNLNDTILKDESSGRTYCDSKTINLLAIKIRKKVK